MSERRRPGRPLKYNKPEIPRILIPETSYILTHSSNDTLSDSNSFSFSPPFPSNPNYSSHTTSYIQSATLSQQSTTSSKFDEPFSELQTPVNRLPDLTFISHSPSDDSPALETPIDICSSPKRRQNDDSTFKIPSTQPLQPSLLPRPRSPVQWPSYKRVRIEEQTDVEKADEILDLLRSKFNGGIGQFLDIILSSTASKHSLLRNGSMVQYWLQGRSSI
ncbi:hypothetical protein K435DRAFT_879841 [Dendrothele bispora CBS 962.96]|uniref:Uncharacterized protein n=1 Tax=Dendrothele bispora (strain CBS 962.96) TaxID=1314807 RepID=A0A4S8KKJ4_DENBC|nr:hypothetical protein K435DRAFT_879841 [Dendrothele bispora CBS 962.96]